MDITHNRKEKPQANHASIGPRQALALRNSVKLTKSGDKPAPTAWKITSCDASAAHHINTDEIYVVPTNRLTAQSPNDGSDTRTTTRSQRHRAPTTE
jgi:hypothetical protein